jgi:hypothetical protein
LRPDETSRYDSQHPKQLGLQSKDEMHLGGKPVDEVLEHGYGQHALAFCVKMRPNFSEKMNIFISGMCMLQLGHMLERTALRDRNRRNCVLDRELLENNNLQQRK